MKALWAHEPIHQDEKRTRGMHQLLKQLVVNPSNIEVGFIVTRHEPYLNLAFDIPADERFSLYPRKLVKESLKKSKVFIDDKNIHIVEYETFSNTKAVDRMLALARSRNADLLALYTHSRHGFQHLVLGSFAETAIHRSRIGLVLVNPNIEFSSKIKRIFFLNDFTPASKKHLKRVIQLSKKLNAKLTVFHHAEPQFARTLDESNPKVHAYRRKVKQWQTDIEHDCKRAKVSCNVIVSAQMWSTSEIALRTAKKSKADLIVLSSKVGPTAALMGGSVARQVVRESRKPVLLLK
jgi:nucleotide-binding universal stress UspA family protein